MDSSIVSSLLTHSKCGFCNEVTSPPTKTSKDFPDLAGLDAALLAKIDALLAKGYMEGNGTDKFDITGNMTRAESAKLVAKIFNLTVGTEATSSFKDVDGSDASSSWSIPFIEAAKKLESLMA